MKRSCLAYSRGDVPPDSIIEYGPYATQHEAEVADKEMTGRWEKNDPRPCRYTTIVDRKIPLDVLKRAERKKVLWLSRHDLSPAQVSAIRALHGENAEIVKDPVVFSDTEGLAEYIRSHSDGFVYAVAGAPHYILAAAAGLHFGMFENHPQKRQDGTFGLAAVYHYGDSSLKKVWVNPDPASDQGEALIPVVR